MTQHESQCKEHFLVDYWWKGEDDRDEVTGIKIHQMFEIIKNKRKGEEVKFG
jgi:hypothetical protein